MVRRLVEERDELRRRLDEMNLSQARGLGIETVATRAAVGKGIGRARRAASPRPRLARRGAPTAQPSQRMGSLPLTPPHSTFTTWQRLANPTHTAPHQDVGFNVAR